MASSVSPRWLRLSFAIAMLSGCGLAAALQAGMVRMRVAVVLAPCALALAIWVLRSTVAWRALRLVALLSALPLGALGLAASSDPGIGAFKVAGLVVHLSCGWLVFLPLWSASSGTGQGEPLSKTPGRWTIPALLFMAGLIGVAARAGLSGRFGQILDENVYLFQAGHVLDEPRGLRLGSRFVPFLIERQMFYREGYLTGQYPPGWPAFLAALRPSGLQSVVGPLLFVACVVSVVALGRRLVSPRVGIVAGVLTAISWRLASVATTYFAHAFCAVLAILACFCLVPAPGEGRRRRGGLEVVAGGLIGYLVATRPLTGVALGATLLLWRWLRDDATPRAVIRTAGLVAAGALGPIVWLLDYNLATTGGAFRFGYDVAHDGLQSLGFGMRGQIAYGEAGVPVRLAAVFGVRAALSHLGSMATDGMMQFWPAMLVLPLIVASVVQRVAVRWRLAAPFLVPVLAQAFFFYPDSRFYVELLPFAMIGTACLIDGLLGRNPRTVPSVLLAVALTAADGTAAFVRQRHLNASRLRYFEEVERARARFGPLLVFVRDEDDPALEQQGFAMLYGYNAQGFPGDVVVARDLGAKNRLLMRCLPDRQPMVVTAAHEEHGVWRPPRVAFLAPAATGPVPLRDCLLEDGGPDGPGAGTR